VNGCCLGLGLGVGKSVHRASDAVGVISMCQSNSVGVVSCHVGGGHRCLLLLLLLLVVMLLVIVVAV
jgi:hypothetical protein